MNRSNANHTGWWILGLSALVVLVVGCMAYVERSTLLAWYHVYRLTHCDEAEQERWAEPTVKLGSAVLPPLLHELRREDARRCALAEGVLARLADRWGPADPRSASLAYLLADRFSCLSRRGQCAVLDLAQIWLAKQPAAAASGPIEEVCERLLSEAARVPDSMVHARALGLAAQSMERQRPSQERHACRELTRSCLRDEEPANRISAIRLASNVSVGLLQPTAELLEDPVPEVRQAAMLALGSAPEAMPTDDLLRWLHDPDAGVRRLCESALRGRGLQEHQMRLGKLLTDDRPQMRLQVLDYLRHHADLDPGVWLRRLCNDPAAAIRAAAIRSAADQKVDSLGDCIRQMAQADPSDSVRQMAVFYLSSQKPPNR
jgi:hypothetical protein